MFTILDAGEGASNLQSLLFQELVEVLVAGIAGNNCVLKGCDCTEQGTPDMTVAVTKGSVLTNGILKPVPAGNVTIGTADGTNPRIDLIVVDSSGTKQVRAGTAAPFTDTSCPKPPNRTANDVVIRAVYVPAGATTITTARLALDLRLTRVQGPVLIGTVTSPVSFSNNSSIQTYYSLTLPNGLFLSGAVLRVRCGGTYLSNSGTPTWTLTIAYGGTTLFADITAAGVAGASRGSWELNLALIAQGNSDQQLQGQLAMEKPATAKVAPTTGLVGDLSPGSGSNANFTNLVGTAAVDADAADRTLTVQWTMSVANAAVDTVMEYATAVLEALAA